MADLKYCYPNSDVLINKLDIRDADKLETFERKLTMLRIMELINNPIKGNYDYKHLKAIHGFIFQDVYDWAGKERTVDIAKGNMFCNVKFISIQAEEIFGKLKDEKYLKGLSKDAFINRLAFYFSEINALHPFREGNGRSQREFIRSLAMYNGYKLNFNNISEEEMIIASRDSFLCKYEKIEEIIRKAVE